MKMFKEMFSGMFTGANKKLIIYLLIFVGIIVLLFIIIGIASLFKGHKYSYSDVEKRLKNAAIAYYAEKTEQLPVLDGGTVTISDTALTQAGKMKELKKLIKNGATCMGSVTIQKNGEYYLYTPSLDCGENYKTVTLTEKIKLDNPVTTNDDGLYEIGENLVFRGEKINNYVSFAGYLWRIIRINNDGTLRLIQEDIKYTGVWDDRYNADKESATGINNFLKSRLIDGLDKIYYELDFFDDDDKTKIVFKDLCIGKRAIDETDNSGAVECASTVEKKPIGLMNVYEYMAASLDTGCVYATDGQCSNYNYLSDYQKTTWTLNADSSNTHKAYKFRGGVGFESSIASNEYGLRLVIYLSNNINYVGGVGTYEDPYIAR